MIAKDEEASIGRALSSVKDICDEIIVVDTGSTDSTKSIAESFGAKVLDHPWEDDFSAPRNTGLEAATSDWILHLDADEELIAGKGHLHRLTDQKQNVLGYQVRIVAAENAEAAAESPTRSRALRLFKRSDNIRYQYPIHEQPTITFDKIQQCELELLHFGKHVENDMNRSGRNMRILKNALEKTPEDSYMWRYLGDEYMTLEDFPHAADAFSRSLDFLADSDAKYIPPMLRSFAWALYHMKQYEPAEELLADALTHYPDYTDLYFVKGCLQHAQGNEEAAERTFSRCLVLGDPDPEEYWTWGGTGSWRAEEGLKEVKQALS